MTTMKSVDAAWQQIRKTLHTAWPRPYMAASLRLIVGVSGGPDSLALLHFLQQRWPADQLLVAHLNHQLRPQAAADAALVAETAAAYGLAFRLASEDVATLAAAEGLSLEAAGRLARYRFFAGLAATDPAAVVVGHHADDQAETVLLHLLRGSGLAGLQGMQFVSALPTAPEIPLLRPLLTTRRQQIEAYCREHSLHPVVDATNTDQDLLRNRVRHELLPLLQTYNPQITTALNQLAAITTADYAFLAQAAAAAWEELRPQAGPGWLVWNRERWQSLPLSLRRLVLRQAILRLRPQQTDVGFQLIEDAVSLLADAEGMRQLALPGELKLHVVYERALLVKATAVSPPFGPQLSTPDAVLPLSVPGSVSLSGWTLTADWTQAPPWAALRDNLDPWMAFVQVGSEPILRVRSRQPGERVQPLGMNGRRASLQDVMVDRKIPQAARACWPLVVGARDEVVWVVGHQIDHRARVKSTADRVVRLRCRPIK